MSSQLTVPSMGILARINESEYRYCRTRYGRKDLCKSSSFSHLDVYSIPFLFSKLRDRYLNQEIS